jgi:hypothetical protein
MGHHEVSDPLRKRRPAARDEMVTVHRLLDRSQLGVRESHVDSVLAGMRHLRPSTLSHRFIDITISENRWNAKAVPITSVTSRFREPVAPLHSVSSSRASSFVWPLPSSFRSNEKPEGTTSVFPGVSNIENPESDGTEVNLPTVVIDFLETNAL